MKKVVIVFLILINCIACSNGQTKPSLDNTQDLSTEILGCWKAVDAHYEIKSNYPNIDSLSLKDRNKFIQQILKNTYISKFSADNTVKDFYLNGNSIGYTDNYTIKKDSIITQNSIRKDSKSASKIAINNDTLYLVVNVFREMKKIYQDLKWNDNIEIPDDIKIETAKRYTKFVRVKDCDQYKKEDE